MYLIANASGKQMVIGDIGLVLKPKQAIDLHKINLKIDPNKSRDLGISIRKGFVKVLKKDSKKSKKIVENITNINTMDQKKLLSSIREIIKQEVKNQTSQPTQILQGQDNQEILEAIQNVMSAVKTQKGTVVVRDGKVIENKEKDLSLDHDTLVEIHSKTVDKRTLDAEGKLEYEDQEIIDIGMGEDLSELEDLL